MRIALFITCFNDTLFPRTGQAVVELLERLGHQVVFPEDQTCCGQMHANSGYQLEAASFGYWSRTMPTQLADGLTTTSASAKTRTKRRNRGRASRA